MPDVLMRDDADYIKLRNKLIKQSQFEGEVLWVYTDHKGLPTIGWGFNIDGDKNLRDAVYADFGIPATSEDEALGVALEAAIKFYTTPYADHLTEAPLIALPPRAGRIFDPLAFDLNNNGTIETLPLLNGVKFDLDNTSYLARKVA